MLLATPAQPGDATLNGHVDLNDLNTVLNHLGQSTPNWTNGNFDGTATIDLNDLNYVLNNLGTTYASNATVLAAEALVAGAQPLNPPHWRFSRPPPSSSPGAAIAETSSVIFLNPTSPHSFLAGHKRHRKHQQREDQRILHPNPIHIHVLKIPPQQLAR